MADYCAVLAPAKVNVGLNVLASVRGGYHDIESVFQSVALCDELSVERARDGAGFELECSGMELPADNTLTAAYKAFCAETGETRGVRATLKKRIPSGAGLGGGSSDAASLVFALEKLCGVSLNAEAKKRIASRVGSDVFFFLLAPRNDGAAFAAVVTGRGERVKTIEARRDIFFVLVCPRVAVSTADAYRMLDEWRAREGRHECGREKRRECAREERQVMYCAPEVMYCADVKTWRFANSFTPLITRREPEIARALSDVRKTGALFADMSGTGSTVYGVYQSEESANAAFLRLNKNWEQCYAC